jgi:hypothetical protein
MSAGPVAFNYANWTALFPELSGVSEAQATLYFYSFAVLYVDNSGRGPINDPNMLIGLLNLTTAHIAKIFSQQLNGVPTTAPVATPGGPIADAGGDLSDAGGPLLDGSIPVVSNLSSPSPLVGRIATATEGTVTVNTEMPDQQPNAAWWNQTIYGAAAWQMMKPFRTFRYLPPTRRRVYNPPYFYDPGRSWR